MTLKIINSPKVKILGIYNQAIQTGGEPLLFLSGCTPVDADGNTVGKGDPAAQMRQTLTNIKTVLEEAGAGLKDVVRVTVFTTDMNNRGPMNQVRLEMFGDHRPASTQVQIMRLVDPDWLVEVECIAALPG